jgi:hypothetical protein
MNTEGTEKRERRTKRRVGMYGVGVGDGGEGLTPEGVSYRMKTKKATGEGGERGGRLFRLERDPECREW